MAREPRERVDVARVAHVASAVLAEPLIHVDRELGHDEVAVDHLLVGAVAARSLGAVAGTLDGQRLRLEVEEHITVKVGGVHVKRDDALVQGIHVVERERLLDPPRGQQQYCEHGSRWRCTCGSGRACA
eukprot:5937162-Prymnesium_polylepis.1